MTKAQKREQRTAAAIAAERQTLGMERAEWRDKRPGILGGVRPLIERLHPWDYAKLPVEEWKSGGVPTVQDPLNRL